MTVETHRRNLWLSLGLLSGLAWLALWVWGQSPYARFLDHDGLNHAHLSTGLFLLLVVAGWNLMLIAMMLPSSLPLLNTFQRLAANRPDRGRLMLLLIGGYLTIWTVFGVLAHLGDGLLHQLVHHTPWLAAHPWVISAGVFILAGLYQFTPLKYQCLDQCRSPLSFITEHWRGHHQSFHAFLLGVHHGLFCIGCCWSLMLLMFAVGMANLGWMFLLGLVMAIERNVSWGRRLVAPLGLVLLAAGLLIVVLGIMG